MTSPKTRYSQASNTSNTNPYNGLHEIANPPHPQTQSHTHIINQVPNSTSNTSHSSERRESTSWRKTGFFGTLKNSLMGTPRFHRKPNAYTGGSMGSRRNSNASNISSENGSLVDNQNVMINNQPVYDNVYHNNPENGGHNNYANHPGTSTKQKGWFTQLVNNLGGSSNSSRSNSISYNAAIPNTYGVPSNKLNLGPGINSTSNRYPNATDNSNSNYISASNYNPNYQVPQNPAPKHPNQIIGSINSSQTSINSSNQQQCATIDTVTVLFEDRTLAVVKADIIHALLILHQLTHNMINSSFFICEYKSSSQSTGMFTKSVKFTIELEIQFNPNNLNHQNGINQVKLNLQHKQNSQTQNSGNNNNNNSDPGLQHPSPHNNNLNNLIGDVCVHFKMLNGTTRRFRKIVQVLYAHICQGPTQQQFLKGMINNPNIYLNQHNGYHNVHNSQISHTNTNNNPNMQNMMVNSNHHSRTNNPEMSSNLNNNNTHPHSNVSSHEVLSHATQLTNGSNTSNTNISPNSSISSNKSREKLVSNSHSNRSKGGRGGNNDNNEKNYYSQLSEFSKEMEQLNKSAANLLEKGRAGGFISHTKICSSKSFSET